LLNPRTVKALHLQVIDGFKTATLVFTRFPVRIGRESPSECLLTLPFVSKVHARLELRDDVLVLIDEGSRNGTFLAGRLQRLAPGVPVELRTVDHEFWIGSIRMKAALVGDDVDLEPTLERPEAAQGSPGDATRNYAAGRVDPYVVDATAARAQVEGPLAAYRRAREALVEGLRNLSSTVDPARLPTVLREVAADCPELLLPTELANVWEPVSAPPDTGAQAALEALQGLSEAYLPYAPRLADPKTIVAFADRLKEAFGLAMEGLAALRFVYLSETGTRASEGSHVPGASDLAACLLDWTTPAPGTLALEQDLVAMVQHHAQLGDQVAKGADRLLAELSPSAIEKELGRAAGLFRWKALWRIYVARHAALVGREGALFGPSFERLRRALEGRSEVEGASETSRRASERDERRGALMMCM
jgi:predicted component of type VI protein secretion system